MNCSRKYSERYVPKWQAPMKPTKFRVCFTVCLETILVIMLVGVTVLVALLLLAPM